MKVIGVTNYSFQTNRPQSVIVEMSGEEFARITQESRGSAVIIADHQLPVEFEINKRYDHAMEVLEAINRARHACEMLHATTNVFEKLVEPCLKEIEAKPKTEH